MVKVELVHPSELGSGEQSAWSTLQALTPEFGSPLLGPAFAGLVGEIRRDARVAIWRDGRRASGFLGFHRTLGGFARPIGAPFSDYHALIAGPDFEAPAEALQAAGLKGVRLTGMVDPHGLFSEGLQPVLAHRIDLSGGADAYLDDLWSASRNRLRNYRRYSRRLERQIGPVRIVASDRSPEAFAALLAWKRRQLTATGLHDFTASPWVSELFHRLFESPETNFGGLMITLYAGERPLAAHFGVRQGGWYHPWIGAYDPDLSEFSPGAVHQVMAAAAAAEAGVRIYDLGPRADRSKTMFANAAVTVHEGLAVGASLPARLAARSERLLGRAGGRLGLLDRARKRWDHVAAVEMSLPGRIAGMARAAGALGRRREAWARAG